ncbi:hypothetical protein [Microbacterium sp. NPDC090003]|uniref:hypothetical protein n=1 Tax=Microbacterium sp. NPDC090003 TaxID=3364203 RepID=UPI0037FBB4C4
MYEQTYSHQVVTAFEQQRLAQEIERRRSVREHADQIVPRPMGVIGRMLARRASALPVPGDRRGARAPQGPVTDAAPARSRAAGAPSEPVAAR